MADATTTRYQYVKPEVGASADTWGVKINQVFDDLDAMTSALATAGSANAYTLTTGLSLTTYVTGQRFKVIPNFSNTGAATLNVDAIGAKNIYKYNGSLGAVASGDIISGVPIEATYDGTQFVIDVSQPRDATLTAVAALSWSSGNALLQFTAADTVSLTLTPSVSSITASQGAANTTPSGTFVNTTDSGALRVLRVEGDRATPATSDNIYVSYYLANASGTAIEFGRHTVIVGSGIAGAEYGQHKWGISVNGTIANVLFLAANLSAPHLFSPNANDGLALGSGALSWADLFLASGGVVNWANGDVVLTHSSGLLSLTTGALQARIALSSETSGSLTAASANKKILASGGITLPDATFTAHDTILIDGNGTARTITRGSGVTMYVNGTDSATATLSANGLMAVSWRTASVCVLTGDVS